jgi:catechol 2,3-dioxygenase-like lactoylglutathione lyase family enzyme
VSIVAVASRAGHPCRLLVLRLGIHGEESRSKIRDTSPMGFHHVAIAIHDAKANYDFYTNVMGFELVKTVTGPTPDGGWSKHFFYSTGTSDSGEQGMIAFWEIHDETIGSGFGTNLNKSANLPWWVNHIAFDAPTMADFERHRERWRSHGYVVLEVDHDFCRSIYIRDPEGNTVEFCHTVRDFTPEEKKHAHELLMDAQPPLEKQFGATLWQPEGEPISVGGQ